MKHLINIIILFTVMSCSNQKCNDTELFNMFIRGFSNQTSAPNFIVLNAVDTHLNIAKEICCESEDLGYALLLDSIEIDLTEISFTNNCIPIIKFKSEKALEQIGYYDYNPELIDRIIENTNHSIIDTILAEHKRTGYSKTLENYTEEYPNNYFEHFLYKNKILTYRDCESGYTMIDARY